MSCLYLTCLATGVHQGKLPCYRPAMCQPHPGAEHPSSANVNTLLWSIPPFHPQFADIVPKAVLTSSQVFKACCTERMVSRRFKFGSNSLKDRGQQLKILWHNRMNYCRFPKRTHETCSAGQQTISYLYISILRFESGERTDMI